MKKTYLIVAMICFLAFAGKAQTFTLTPKGDISQTVLDIKNLYADNIIIEGVSSNEIKIETDDYEGIPDKAKGLKPLSATGPENTGIGLSVQQEGNRITVSGASRNADGEYRFSVPKNMMLVVDLNNWQAGDLTIKGMAGEVEAHSQNGDIRFENVTGPLVVKTLSSDIEVIFSSVSQKSPTSIFSTSGDIDIVIPEATKGSFEMSTTSGEIYTDLNFKFPEEKEMSRFGGAVSGSATLNGGGVELSLRSISGDIFIRKAK